MILNSFRIKNSGKQATYVVHTIFSGSLPFQWVIKGAVYSINCRYQYSEYCISKKNEFIKFKYWGKM